MIFLQFTTNALVVKEMNIGESDKLITLMTADFGIIKAYASGVKSIKSKRASSTGLLSYANFTITKKGENYRVSEVSPITSFFGVGSDITVLALAQYFCELCVIIEPPAEESKEFLRLILNSLYFLKEKSRNPVLIKAITELRVMSAIGYMPNLIACEGCGKFEDDIMYFVPESGSVYCLECYNGNTSIKINKTVLYAMRHIVYSALEKIYSFDIPKKETELLSHITEKYLTLHTDQHFKTLDFYNSIK